MNGYIKLSEQNSSIFIENAIKFITKDVIITTSKCTKFSWTKLKYVEQEYQVVPEWYPDKDYILNELNTLLQVLKYSNEDVYISLDVYDTILSFSNQEDPVNPYSFFG